MGTLSNTDGNECGGNRRLKQLNSRPYALLRTMRELNSQGRLSSAEREGTIIVRV